MEAVYYAARANLQRLLRQYPDWTRSQLAQATGMSISWIDKWKKRLLQAPDNDEQVLHGLSCAPHHPRPRASAAGGGPRVGDSGYPSGELGSHSRLKARSCMTSVAMSP
ncbi:MAG TPA: hypothetical protein VF043_00685 [Ktedonobacteraceae bacterium]